MSRIVIVQNDPLVPAGYSAELADTELVQVFNGQPLPVVKRHDPAGPLAGVVILGGTMSSDDEASCPHLRVVKKFIDDVLDAQLPMLGICLGAQLLAQVLGARVTHQCYPEHGLRKIQLTEQGGGNPLFAGLPTTLAAFQWHDDSFQIPHGADHLAASEQCAAQAFRYQQAYGVQFHPEVTSAIVTSWCDYAGGHDDVWHKFKVAEGRYRRQHGRLLHNFYQGIRRVE